MLSRFSIALALLMAAERAALAAEGDIQPPPDKCRLQPQAVEPQQPDGSDPANNDSTSAAPDLEGCDGILKPPATGDQEMTQPPPAVGEMPIVKPGDLPEQQSNPQ